MTGICHSSLVIGHLSLAPGLSTCEHVQMTRDQWQMTSDK
jgi:hypothetical protein